jgi:hypothetical protein
MRSINNNERMRKEENRERERREGREETDGEEEEVMRSRYDATVRLQGADHGVMRRRQARERRRVGSLTAAATAAWHSTSTQPAVTAAAAQSRGRGGRREGAS